MENQKPQMQPKVDLKLTTPITSEDGHHIFQEGVIMRKISKFVIQSPEDGIIPIPIFFDIRTGKIMLDTLPKELREEYKGYNDAMTKNDGII